ncbi:MAG: peptide deformylase [Anaerolineales bacterium]|nr:peptide deformylase [Anaerolineales bacterium]
MPIRPIIGPDNPVLRRKAKTLDNPNIPALQQLIEDMIETMRAAPGVGLAAPQVAVSQRLAVIEYAEPPENAPEDAEPPEPKLYVIVNPEIVARSEVMVDGTEGCLSLPGYAGNVMRHQAVTVKALNRRGKPIKVKARGWLARIFQHEIDHLDGILYIDRASKVWRVEADEAAADPGLRE